MANQFLQQIKQNFKTGSTLTKLIYINIGFFLLNLVFRFFFSPGMLMYYNDLFCLPSSFSSFIRVPWTIITYMFEHYNFGHIFWNMLSLYVFGRIFLQLFTQRQLVGLYVLSGISGGLFFMLAYNFVPYFQNQVASSTLLGASAAVMGIIVAIALRTPNYPIRLLFIGEVKLYVLAIVMVAMSLFQVSSSNAGGEISHLGGALFGALYYWLLTKNLDMTRPINRFIDWSVNLFKPHQKNEGRYRPQFRKKFKDASYQTDAEYNQSKAKNNAVMDEILDKVKRSGYDSLTKEEKKRLFDSSKKC